MLKKQQDSTRIRRRDVSLDPHIFNSFLRGMATNGVSMAEIVLGLDLYLEPNGNVVAECWLKGDKAFDFHVFGPEEWEIKEDVDGLTRRVLEAARPKPSRGDVVDIFSGNTIKKK